MLSSKKKKSHHHPHGDGATAAVTGDDTAHFLTAHHFNGVGELKAHDNKIIEAAKKAARSELRPEGWMRQGWAYDRGCTREPAATGVLPREAAADLSVAAFVARYEVPNLPVMITGCADAWPAMHGAWLPAALLERYRHRRFKVGEDDDGYPVKLKLKYFLRYMRGCRDDSPLYVFDSMYESADRSKSCGIMHDYTVPPYFAAEDLFRLVGEHRRPPYRWFLVGPTRSGTCVHIDPLGTSAWNTLVYGLKRWVLWPPQYTREQVRGRHLVRPGDGPLPEAVDYFTVLLPRVLEAGGPEMAAHTLQFVQRPGETVYVPGGWQHAVLNLSDTVAITQNYCSTANFARVWPAVRAGRRCMARMWLRTLAAARPDLHAAAAADNAAAGWDAATEAARHAARKAAARVARARRLRERAAREERRVLRAAAAAAAAARAAAGGGADSGGSDSSDDNSSDDSSSDDSGSDSDESSGSETSDSSEAEEGGATAGAGASDGKTRTRAAAATAGAGACEGASTAATAAPKRPRRTDSR